MEALKVQPEFRAGAKEMPQAQCGVAGQAALTVQDLRNAVRRHLDLTAELPGAYSERLQFFTELFARMNRRAYHDVSLQIVLRALIELGLKRDNHPALLANVEGQAKAVRHQRSVAGRAELRGN